ncbi:hypothetical protein OAG34_02075, partial [bacterium]|nr:hypothetical protein [bacterium]
MNHEQHVLLSMTAMRLLNAGRFQEAIDLLPSHLPGLRAFLCLQSRQTVVPPKSRLGDLVRGWQHYYQANYQAAFDSFSHAESTESEWLRAYAWLGKGKVCNDLGFFADAAWWCSNAACLARQFEHSDLVAAAQGARGEILLRTGHARLAAEAFTLDAALLPTSDRFRGRVMCYQAHAYRRLRAYSAAKLAYRTSAQQPGEETAPYANAGLAMLGAETGDRGLIEEAVQSASLLEKDRQKHPSIGWTYVAKARLSQIHGQSPRECLTRAQECMPAEHVFEHRWLRKWMDLVSEENTSDPSADTKFEGFRPESPPCDQGLGSNFDGDPIEALLPNEGLANVEWANDLEDLWLQRD